MTVFRVHRLSSLAASLLIGFGFGGCATPVAPTGGPRDTTPPALVSSKPASSSVNFASDRVSLTFSEKVDRASFQRALSFTPEISPAPELEWDGASVEIVLVAPLRDSTTYILTLDNQLRDDRGVEVDRPITLAFSTGSVIDRGRIIGRIAEPASNAPAGGFEVFAFEGCRVPEGDCRVVGTQPGYRTQTDSDGSFEFSNLPFRNFFVVGVEDRNRNRLIDSLEAVIVALPFWGSQYADTVSTYAIETAARSAAASAGSRTPTWYVNRSDDRPPAVLQLRSLSSSRTEIRFSEPIRLDALAPSEWGIVDTLTQGEYDVSEIYQPPDGPNRVVLVTEALPEGAYAISRAGTVRDTTGNMAAVIDSGNFEPSDRGDTLRIRFGGFGPAALQGQVIDLGAEMHPEIRFNRFIDPSVLALITGARDAEGNPRAVDLRTSTGTIWTVSFSPPAEPGDSITVSVEGLPPLDTVYAKTFAFLDAEQTGRITGVVEDVRPATVELISKTGPMPRLEVQTDSAGRFTFNRLLKGNYSLRAYIDLDHNERWTPGGLSPVQLPEPMVWNDELIEVRKGWESALDTLRFPRP